MINNGGKDPLQHKYSQNTYNLLFNKPPLSRGDFVSKFKLSYGNEFLSYGDVCGCVGTAKMSSFGF